MFGQREALYDYSWEQLPISDEVRPNSPEGEKEIFKNWFEDTTNEYYRWTKDKGLDDETIRANASWALSPPPVDPEVYRALTNVSPKTLERLRKPKKDRKAEEEKEEARKKAEHQANINRYEKSLKEIRKAVDHIKEERQRKRACSQVQSTTPSDVPSSSRNSVCRTVSDLSPFRKRPYKLVVVKKDERESAEQEENHLPVSFHSGSNPRWKDTASSNKSASSSTTKTPVIYDDEASDSELLKLALESSPIRVSKSTKNSFPEDDELSDEALLTLMTQPSPTSSPKSVRNKWSANPSQLLSTESALKIVSKNSPVRSKPVR